MFEPRIPVNPAPTGEVIPVITTPPAYDYRHAPTDCFCRHQDPAPAATQSRPAVQMTPGTVLALVGGGTVAVLVIGAVLVSMLLAVAITAASLAICALVIRSLLSSDRQSR
ncbi:SpdD-like protein [Streptomyces sp. KL118A]|uniref:SpdD-like protein n=1 Tax=Streptomyces sp. KL118A TaxID=3045153 RepID=UPI00278C38B9|nr:SpdD-like protein [Streptomyces sp. KL118A]